MKLVTFRRAGSAAEEVGILRDGGILPLRELGCPYDSMNELILGASRRELRELEGSEGALLPMAAATLLSPIPHPLQDILCLGRNYAEHMEESARFHGEKLSTGDPPVFFAKRVNCSQGDGAPIPAHGDLTQQLDYECELAVILGRDAENVPPEDVADYVFGYTVLNDVSARDLQKTHKQWYFGKSLDGFAPMGPCIVTADEIPWPPQLDITCTVNGQLRQSSNTAALIHSIGEVVSLLSRGMTLKAGAIIATGTPSGVAMGMAEPQFLRPGDVVTCAVQGIGRLTNTVE